MLTHLFSRVFLAVFVVLLFSCQAPTRPSPSEPSGTQATATFGTVTKIHPEPSNTLATAEEDWYKDQVFYQVWVKSFRDSNGDGIGDLAGVTSKLDYLDDLGVTALWLSPIFKNNSSTANLHGYDTTDYEAIDPRFGTEADLQDLLQAAHAKGMRVIFDFVPNHVSSRHPWFLDSVANRNGKKDWFLWKNAPPSQGWWDIGGGGAGSGFHRSSNGQYYYGIFWDGMPDLNYRNPEVRTAIANVVVKWLNFGFDGMRVDAVKYLYENPVSGANADQPETISLFQHLRSEILDPYAKAGAAKFMVAENWTDDTQSLKKYLRNNGTEGFQATMDFPLGYGITAVLNQGLDASAALGGYYSGFVAPAQAAGGWTFSFLSNHDNYQSRPKTAFSSDQKVRLAQALQAVSWGTPILYYGNEIGMTGAAGNDSNLRSAFDWSLVTTAQAKGDSPYQWQRTLNRLKHERVSLRRGSFAILPSTAGTVAVARSVDGETTVLVANLGFLPLASATVDLSGVAVVGLSTLVGATSNAVSGATLTLTDLPACGVRVFALEASDKANLRGDFADGVPKIKVWAGAKDRSTASLTVSFYDGKGSLLATQSLNSARDYTSNGDYWWYPQDYDIVETKGFLRWQKASPVYDSGLVAFDIGANSGEWVVGFPNHNTGLSDTWYLRGIGNDWVAGVPLTAVAGEPRHFVATLTASEVPATGVQFKVNADNNGAWDYFFGFHDVEYDTALGDAPSGLGYRAASGGDDNFWFKGDGVSSYEVHFLNRQGICRVWIKRVVL